MASPGQRKDIAYAHELIDRFQRNAPLPITLAMSQSSHRQDCCDAGCRRSTEAKPKRRSCDGDLYKERNIIALLLPAYKSRVSPHRSYLVSTS
jgi:hypothetical protein